MGKRANRFDDCTASFFDALVEIEFLSYVNKQQSGNTITQARHILEESRAIQANKVTPKSHTLGLAMCLSIPNVTKSFQTYLSYGRKAHMDEEMIRIIQEAFDRALAQTICTTYEAFEIFLKRFAPILFFAKRKAWNLVNAKAFHKRNPAMGKQVNKNTTAYIQAYVKFVARDNCNLLLNELKAIFPTFTSECSTNAFWDFFEAWKSLSCMRHAIVHDGGEPTTSDLNKLSKFERDGIRLAMKASVLTGRETILPAVGVVTRCIETVAGLAYCLYVHASRDCHMKLRTFP